MSRIERFGCPVQTESAGLLLEYLDRRLDPSIAVELERHVAVCPDCQRVVSAQQAVWDALDNWEPVPISGDFDERLFARLEAERARPGLLASLRAFIGSRFSMRAVIPAAVACTLLVGVFAVRAPTSSSGIDTQIEAIDVEQVETTLAEIDALQQLGVSQSADDGSSTKAL
jgi:anti-sigma factor RsiW